MVALQILVLPAQVRILVPQQPSLRRLRNPAAPAGGLVNCCSLPLPSDLVQLFWHSSKTRCYQVLHLLQLRAHGGRVVRACTSGRLFPGVYVSAVIYTGQSTPLPCDRQGGGPASRTVVKNSIRKTIFLLRTAYSGSQSVTRFNIFIPEC